ncbi:hypothetical protein D3C71_362170 [compost metagenome]
MHFRRAFDEGDVSSEGCEQEGIAPQPRRGINDLWRAAFGETRGLGQGLSAPFAGTETVSDRTAYKIHHEAFVLFLHLRPQNGQGTV